MRKTIYRNGKVVRVKLDEYGSDSNIPQIVRHQSTLGRSESNSHPERAISLQTVVKVGSEYGSGVGTSPEQVLRNRARESAFINGSSCISGCTITDNLDGTFSIGSGDILITLNKFSTSDNSPMKDSADFMDSLYGSGTVKFTGGMTSVLTPGTYVIYLDTVDTGSVIDLQIKNIKTDSLTVLDYINNGMSEWKNATRAYLYWVTVSDVTGFTNIMDLRYYQQAAAYRSVESGLLCLTPVIKSGLIISELSGQPRNLVVGSGIVSVGNIDYRLADSIPAGAHGSNSKFSVIYGDNTAGWTSINNSEIVPNNKIWDGSSFADYSGSDYLVYWIYVSKDKLILVAESVGALVTYDDIKDPSQLPEFLFKTTTYVRVGMLVCRGGVANILDITYSHGAGSGSIQGSVDDHANKEAGSGVHLIPKNNMVALVPPEVTDDETQKYLAGSRWLISGTDTEYVCIDSSVGAAVWVKLTDAAYVKSEAIKYSIIF
jgi:hypothetical protein